MASPHPPRQAVHPPSSPFHTPTTYSPLNPSSPVPTSTSQLPFNDITSGNPFFGSANHSFQSTSSAFPSLPFNQQAHNFGSTSHVGFGFGGSGPSSNNFMSRPQQSSQSTLTSPFALPPVASSSSSSTSSSVFQSSTTPTFKRTATYPLQSTAYALTATPEHRPDVGMPSHQDGHGISRSLKKRRQSSVSSSNSVPMHDDSPDYRPTGPHSYSQGQKKRRRFPDANSGGIDFDGENDDDNDGVPPTVDHSDQGGQELSGLAENLGEDLLSKVSVKDSRPVKRLRGENGNDLRNGPATNLQNQDLSEAVDGGDLGVLLASFPPQTHLQLLHSLIQQRPDLRPLLLSLLPPPELEYCIVSLEDRIAKIKEAMPIGAGDMGSSTSSPSITRLSSPIGGARGISFGTPIQPRVGFGFNQQQTNISDGYVLNRLRGPVNEFCQAATTFLPYFLPGGKRPPSADSALPAIPPHASLSFQYLHFVTDLIVARLLPLLPKASPAPAPVAELLDSVLSGWVRWIDALSEHVNKGAGMYPASTVEGWYKALYGLASIPAPCDDTLLSQSPLSLTSKLVSGVNIIKNRWVQEVGWLIGMSA